MIERPQDQEQNTPTEPMGLPADLFDDPAKYDGDIPLWKRTVTFVNQFKDAKPKKQKTLLDQMSVSIARKPRTLGNFLDNLSLISEISPEIDLEGIESGLILQVEIAVSRRSDLPKWIPEKIEELIRLGIDSSGRTREVVERMKKALFNAPRNIEESVDLHYSSAWAMVSTSQPDVKEEIFSILALEKEWLTPYSPSVIYRELGNVAPDDVRLSKYSAINLAFSEAGRLLELNKNKMAVGFGRAMRVSMNDNLLEEVILSPRNRAIVERVLDDLERRNPFRYRQLRQKRSAYKKYDESFQGFEDSYRAELDKLTVQRDLVSKAVWPEDVILNSNEPLSKMVRGQLRFQTFRAKWENLVALSEPELVKLTKAPIQLTDDLQLDIISLDFESEEQRSALIREVRDSIRLGKAINPKRDLYMSLGGLVELARVYEGGILGIYSKDESTLFALSRSLTEPNIGRFGSIIEYHRPLISLEQLKNIELGVSNIRQDLQTNFTRSVGMRGHELLVSDPALKTLGYESVTFKQTKENDISVAMKIDGQLFEFTLDQAYRIKLGGDIKQFLNPQDQAWLELLTLSHLKKLMCTEEDSLIDELVGGKKQHEYYRRQKIGRIEHLRRLPPGQNFSTDAYIKCLKSDLPVKQLDRINKMRAERGLGGTKETGIWTYISGVERDIDTGQAKPVKISFATATDDIRKVIPLGEISQEELDRIEREILSELEIT